VSREPEPGKRTRTQWRPVDRVALVLAFSLGLLVNLILITTIVQILDHTTPELQLSENSTQIIIAAMGAIAGLLGAYIGLNRGIGKDDNDGKPEA
jgi:ABC-type nickel/cobalt efflux system permease component RcnA